MLLEVEGEGEAKATMVQELRTMVNLGAQGVKSMMQSHPSPRRLAANRRLHAMLLSSCRLPLGTVLEAALATDLEVSQQPCSRKKLQHCLARPTYQNGYHLAMQMVRPDLEQKTNRQVVALEERVLLRPVAHLEQRKRCQTTEALEAFLLLRMVPLRDQEARRS